MPNRVNISDYFSTLTLTNRRRTTERLLYVLDDGTVDTIEIYPDQTAIIPTENLATLPSYRSFNFDDPKISDPNLRALLNLGGGPPAAVLRDLTLSLSTLLENSGPGTRIGAFIGGYGPESTYALVDNAGGRLATTGINLIAGLVATDYEMTPTLTCIVRETVGLVTHDTPLTITVTDVNEAIYLDLQELHLSNTSLPENGSPSNALGTLSGVTAGTTLTVMTGKTQFGITGIVVYPLVSFDFEAGINPTLVIRETDPNYPQNYRDSTFVITITDVVEFTPVVFNTIDLSTKQIPENNSVNDTIGTITNRTTGTTLSVVAGAVNVNLSANVVRANRIYDFEAGTSFTFTIRETDVHFPSNFKDTPFTVNVTDIDETVLLVFGALSLSSSVIVEEAAIGTTIGNVVGRTSGGVLSLRTTNVGVALTGGTIQSSKVFDFETQTSFQITLRETDPNHPTNFRDTTLTINVENLDEVTPVVFNSLALSNSVIQENNSVGATLGSITNRTPGTTLSLISGPFTLNPSTGAVTANVSFDRETTSTVTFKVRETDSNFNSNINETTFTVTVANVLEVTLGALTPNTLNILSNVAAGTSLMTVAGATAGGTVSVAANGNKVVYDAATNSVLRGGGAVTTSFSFDLVETHPDALNAPRTTTVNVTVTEALTTLTPTSGSYDTAQPAGTTILDFPAQVAGESRTVFPADARFAINGAGDLVRGSTGGFVNGTLTTTVRRTRGSEVVDTPVTITITGVATPMPDFTTTVYPTPENASSSFTSAEIFLASTVIAIAGVVYTFGAVAPMYT